MRNPRDIAGKKVSDVSSSDEQMVVSSPLWSYFGLPLLSSVFWPATSTPSADPRPGGTHHLLPFSHCPTRRLTPVRGPPLLRGFLVASSAIPCVLCRPLPPAGRRRNSSFNVWAAPQSVGLSPSLVVGTFLAFRSRPSSPPPSFRNVLWTP